MRGAKPRFSKVFAKAATTWPSLGVAGVAAVAAAALASWPILAVGGAAYGALVAWDLASPDFWKRALGEAAAESQKLPDPAKCSDPQLAAGVKGILAARGEIAKVLADTPDSVKAELSGAVAQIVELERHASRLVERGEDLYRYLGKRNSAEVRPQIEDLRRRIAGARDAEARTQYESALHTREEQLRALEDLEDSRERIGAQLLTIVAGLEGLPAKIVRMRTLDAQALDELSGNVNEELSRMNGEMKVFEETLAGLKEVTL